MTPLIAKMAATVPDVAADLVWFDIHEAWNRTREMYTHEKSMSALQNPLPFPKCAVVAEDSNGDSFLVAAAEAARPTDPDSIGLLINTVVMQEGLPRQAVPFFCNPKEKLDGEEGLTIYFLDKKYDASAKALQSAQASLVALSFWLNRLNAEAMPAYTPTARAGHAKRLRQGKKPMFDWHTVTIEPKSAKGEALGGTHASPRLHDVRGHWVTRNGKKFWRRSHQRGDASLGIVFKDYKFGEARV